MIKLNRIAVIILNYFGADFTKACIDSVRLRLQSVVFLIDNSADKAEKIKLLALFDEYSDVLIFFPRESWFCQGC